MKPFARRLLIFALATVAVLLALAGTLYAFGGPERVAESDEAVYEATVPVESQAPEQTILSIPGCTCHSDDPKLRAEHERYRIRDCGNCHDGGPPVRP